MIEIPALDFFIAFFVCSLSTLAFYQGWLITFKNKKLTIFTYALAMRIATLFGKKGDEYRERISSALTPPMIKRHGFFSLIGGFLGLCGGILMILDAITRVVIK